MLKLKDHSNDLYKLVIAAGAASAAMLLAPLFTGSFLIQALITGIAAGSTSIYDIYRVWKLNRTIEILILEDTEEDLKQVKNVLEDDFKLFTTHDSKIALRQAKRNKNLKFGVVDELLLDQKGGRQTFQGLDIIKILADYRPDMKFIILTGEIITESTTDDMLAIAEKIDKFLDNKNVVDVIHKQLYKDKENNYRGSLHYRIISKIKLLIKAGDLR